MAETSASAARVISVTATPSGAGAVRQAAAMSSNRRRKSAASAGLAIVGAGRRVVVFVGHGDGFRQALGIQLAVGAHDEETVVREPDVYAVAHVVLGGTDPNDILQAELALDGDVRPGTQDH